MSQVRVQLVTFAEVSNDKSDVAGVLFSAPSPLQVKMNTKGIFQYNAWGGLDTGKTGKTLAGRQTIKDGRLDEDRQNKEGRSAAPLHRHTCRGATCRVTRHGNNSSHDTFTPAALLSERLMAFKRVRTDDHPHKPACQIQDRTLLEVSPI
ncbi:hypothetical protein EYF80_024356 [Liparis tanakae]|uniref:Uncharacterized protein n=1 Tax=Liparis tanakae TaxID=230148 RepID=A0A4Z2HI22_9TELE|nr:hypothetical protein EYF80_024356 [Liparis tanakae]